MTLSIELHQLFLAGFSGGGYPLRLAALTAATESRKPSPRYTVLGCVSYFGMGGDLLHDHWLTPRGAKKRPLDMSRLVEEQETLRSSIKHWYEPSAPEVSDVPYTDGMTGQRVDRGNIWDYWHATGSINDAITGEKGFSARMAAVPYHERIAAIPAKQLSVFPQIALTENAATIPPFLLIHGDADKEVPYEESSNTLRALQEGGGHAELITIPDADHALKVNDQEPPATLEAYSRTVEWMLERLASARGA